MTDFKPDYLCDNPVCKEALSELLETIKTQADEIERLTRQVDLFKNTLEATEQMVTHLEQVIDKLRDGRVV